MSIKSTRTVSRETALLRIIEINALIAASDYRGIEATSNEDNADLRSFVDTGVQLTDVSKWTNKMLEDQLDVPFYRFSMFDNYFVTDSGKEE